MLSFPQDVLLVLHCTDCMMIGDNKKKVSHAIFSMLAADVYICKALQLMNQHKMFIYYGPYEGYLLVQRSVFYCRGLLVSYAAEECLLL